jgi:hypothetical protein
MNKWLKGDFSNNFLHCLMKPFRLRNYMSHH